MTFTPDPRYTPLHGEVCGHPYTCTWGSINGLARHQLKLNGYTLYFETTADVETYLSDLAEPAFI